jgi:hypothetical protein
VSHPIRRLDDLAECCVFVKQSVNAICCGPPCGGHPLSRSYGANVPSSLERFLSRAWVHLHPPTCVGLRYGRRGKQPQAFLGKLSGDSLRPKARLGIRLPGHFSPCVTRGLDPRRCRNIKRLCIDYALRPHLSSRLTLGGRTCPRKPWVYGDQDSHLVYRYSCLHSHFRTLHFRFPSSFAATGTLSYQTAGSRPRGVHSFGIPFDRQSFSARHRSMSQLLRTV